MKQENRLIAWAKKNVFVASVLVMAVVSVCIGVLMLFLPGPACLLKLERSDRIALFSLWMDIVIGGFTIWGLKWAASEFAEFAAKPNLRLFPGEGNSPSSVAGVEKFFLLL